MSSSYDNLLRIIAEQPVSILVAVAWSLVTVLALLLVGGWLPVLVWGRWSADASGTHSQHDEVVPVHAVSLLALMLGGGVMLSVALGTLSAYVAKSVLPGMVLSVVFGLTSTLLLIRNLRVRRLNLGTSRQVFAAVSACAVLLTLWHHAVSDFADESDGGRRVIFTDLNGDTSFHVYLAMMIRETGLPLRDLYGSPFREYSQVTHTGHGVLIAGIASVLPVTEFRASASLWVAASVLLCWSSMAVVIRSKVSGKFVVAAGLIPLVFGPLMLPSSMPLLHPEAALAIDPGISNRMYWNLPQALSTALAALGLILFDGYCRSERGDAGRPKLLVLVCVVIVASGWVKPSLFILYAPALLVTLLVQRARLTELVSSFVLLAMGVVVYLLPAFLVDVPEVPSWNFHPNVEQTVEVAKFVGYGCGAVLLLAVSPLARLFRELVHPQQPRVLTLPLVAMGGSLLFALLFREERFVGFKAFQPNIWWGPSACVLLLIPLLIRHAVRQESHEGRTGVLRMAAAVLMLLHVISGSQFAVATPAINLRPYPKMSADALVAAQQQTSSHARFLLDPLLASVDLAGYLRRPALFSTNYMFPEDSQILDDWSQLFEESAESTGTGWTNYNAAIIAESSTRAQAAMRSQGWAMSDLTPGFQLWERSLVMLNSVDDNGASSE